MTMILKMKHKQFYLSIQARFQVLYEDHLPCCGFKISEGKDAGKLTDLEKSKKA